MAETKVDLDKLAALARAAQPKNHPESPGRVVAIGRARFEFLGAASPEVVLSLIAAARESRTEELPEFGCDTEDSASLLALRKAVDAALPVGDDGDYEWAVAQLGSVARLGEQLEHLHSLGCRMVTPDGVHVALLADTLCSLAEETGWSPSPPEPTNGR